MNPAEREELARLLPSPGEPVLPSDRQSLLKGHLMREFTQKSAPVPRRRVVKIAVPLVTAAAVVAVALAATGSGEPDKPVTDQEAVALLNRIATVADAKQTVPVRDDQFVYTRVQGTDWWEAGKEWKYRRTDWQAVDGRREGLATITVLDPPPGGGPFRGGKSTFDMVMGIDPNNATYRKLEALPADPEKLYQKIWADTEGQGPTHEEAAMEMIDSMLDRSVLIPDVSAALYRAAAKIPGVTVVEDAQDAAGRHGIGLTFQDSDDLDTWVFDKTSLDYLGTDETALLGIGVVDKVGETPSS
ncbi:hypothetical protein StrepF001_43010 [Streptomyces sp. F001]|uniref:CU044_5270 family protein n=1 Tax=Streptomyces sp. F001 TaxID=1510026 RepID=UPI00101E4F7A|nr:CU044_5270 family protein [Streptomyces sp. F001]RZB13642.1 hypothetical protein StrepF001_43010 [Streptomyces sp. F001]